MAGRCDCCGCVLVDDYGTSTVTGAGTEADPYMVTRVDPDFIRPAVRITRVTTLATTNNTPETVPFTAEVFDTDNMWDVGNPTRITFNTAGVYSFGANWQWPSNTTGRRGGDWFYTPFNGVPPFELIEEDVQTTSGVFRRQLNYQWFFQVGDYIELDVTQSSGGALNLNAASAWAVYHGRKV